MKRPPRAILRMASGTSAAVITMWHARYRPRKRLGKSVDPVWTWHCGRFTKRPYRVSDVDGSMIRIILYRVPRRYNNNIQEAS